LTTYGAVEDGVTPDTGAINTWLADGAMKRVWLEGTSLYGATFANFTKRAMGPGRYTDGAGNWYPADWMWMLTSPTRGTGTDVNYYFSGDLSHIDAQYFILGGVATNVRLGLTEPYFESVTTPKFAVFTNYSGASGTITHVAVASIAGAITMQVDSTAGLITGQTLGFLDVNGNVAESKVITVVDGTHISWTGGLANAYPQYRGLRLGARTMNKYQFLQATHNGAGDGGGITIRGIQGYVPTTGQVHYFETSTLELIGGDLTHTAAGNFSTVLEFRALDQGFDVAHNTFVMSFNRDNDAGARSVVWMGLYFKSEGSRPIDAFARFTGKSRSGLDFAFADFSSNGQAAIMFAKEQRLYWGCAITNGGRGALQTAYGYGGNWTNTLGDISTYGGFDGVTDHYTMQVGASGSGLGTYIRITRAFGVGIGCDLDVNGVIASERGSPVNIAFGYVEFIKGSGNGIQFNTVTNKFDFIKDGVVTTSF
jgi:hypothetical protein